jgi:subtilisin
MSRYHATSVRAFVAVLSLLAGIVVSAQTPAPGDRGLLVSDSLRARAERNGRVRVLVELKLAAGRHVAEGELRTPSDVTRQRNEILNAFARIDAKLGFADRRVLHRYRTVPYVALEVTPAGLAALEAASSDIASVLEDEILWPVLAQSAPLIQADQAWAAGFDGTGTTIAVLDTGVDSTHPFLAGKVVAEACFSTTSSLSASACPNGTDQQIGVGAGAPCSAPDCLHGTHVAGIAAGNGTSAGQPFSGVARGADVMAVIVFAIITDPGTCPTGNCVGAFSSDIIAGLEHVYSLAASHNVASVNMSLGTASTFTTNCDTQPFKPAIDNLRAIGVPTVIAAGNGGSGTGLSVPGCISSAVSVGSTDKSNQVSPFSNVAPFLSLFAPGSTITSSVPGGGFNAFSGTSMATPHVAGTWAILHQAAPTAGVGLILDALRQTGLPITDTRPVGVGTTVPRVSIFEALGALVPVTNPAPVLTATSPARLRASSTPVILTLIGSDFVVSSAAYWNGAPRPTVVESTTQLKVQLTPADLAGIASGDVHVITPAPGGGTSVTLTVPIDPPPSLTHGVTAAVPPGTAVTVTLADGFGGSGDWLAFARTGSPNTSYLLFTYVGANVLNRTWTVTMPSTPGQYEFRLFLNNVFTLAATSPPVTVDASMSSPPAITSLSPVATAAGSPAFTLTVNGSAFVGSSVVQWNGSPRPTTFVSSTRLQAAIGAADVAVISANAVTVFTPPPGGGTSSPVTFNASGPPVLEVSATTAAPGESVTVTLLNGTGGLSDWMSFALTTAANSSYVTYTYVGYGVITRTWTVTMPATQGNYEFRYFQNGGYTRAATSPTVTVQGAGGPNPAPVATSLSPNSATAGSAGFNLTVNGSGFVPSSVVRWNGADRATTFLSATQIRATIAAADVASAGNVSVTVFSPATGGGTSAPLTFTVGQGQTPAPQLTVSATTVAPGGTVTVTLTGGLGGIGDWLAFALKTAPNNSYVTYTYVGMGVTTRTWTVTVPATPGAYEFRLFLNNGYVRSATSPTVTVQ